MKNAKSPSRAQRRLYEKYLRKFHPDQFKSWKLDAQKRGESIHEQHVEATNKELEARFEDLQSKVMESHKNFYNCEDEVSRKYAEDFISSTKIWREDTSLRMKDIIRENP